MMFSTKEVAEILGVSPNTLKRWRDQGVGPAWIRLGPKLIKYPAVNVEALWLTMVEEDVAAVEAQVMTEF